MENRRHQTRAMEKPLHVFCCYARTDQPHLRELQTALDPLRRIGLIAVSTDINISPGENWKNQIQQYLHTAHIILLLVSPDFIASDYCYDIEMKQAVKRHQAGDALVIPIILRPCSWQNAPFATIQALPTHASPITTWADKDNAYLDVVNGIKGAIDNLISPALDQRDTTSLDDTHSQGASKPQQQQAGSSKFIIQNDASVRTQIIGNHSTIHIGK